MSTSTRLLFCLFGCFAPLATTACATSREPQDDLGPTQTSTASLQEVRFLNALGTGTDEQANAYYAATIRGFAPGAYSLGRWMGEFLVDSAENPLITSYYRNTNDLGFWREMYCTTRLGRGVGGCAVVNWRTATDRAQGFQNLGTVAMNVSPEGYSRFYAFNPAGTLTPSVVLDSEGPKSVPGVCIVCHGGSYDAARRSPDVGAVFREFETSFLEAPPGVSRDGLEASWRSLNRSIRTANESLRPEAEGALRGVDFARTSMGAHLDELYAGGVANGLPVSTQALPASWTRRSDSAALASAKSALWRTVVAPSCMTCHRVMADYDFSNYDSFARTLGRASGDRTRLEQLVSPAGRAQNTPFMPQAELAFNALMGNGEGARAIASWVAESRPPR